MKKHQRGGDVKREIAAAREGSRRRKVQPGRWEFNYDAAEEVYAELVADAAGLGITPQQLIHLILVARHNARHGRPFLELLWPGAGTARAATPDEPAEEPPNEGAAGFVEDWM